MPTSSTPPADLPEPTLSDSEAKGRGLRLESTLAELPLYSFQVDASIVGKQVAALFDRHPLLPGVVLLEQGQFLGMISRQRLLEFLLHPQGTKLFLSKPLRVLHSYARSENLILPDTTSILAAAQLALRRSPSERTAPILVQAGDGTYRMLDIHELNIAYWQIRGLETQVRYERTQVQMIQTEKMASLGRLVDGVAHEILDPVGFIWGNLVHVSTYTNQVMELLEAYEQHFSTVPEAIVLLQEEIELDYLRHDLPQTISSIRTGAERLKKLVASLQNFCHIDNVYPKPANLHDCLDSLLLLLKSRLSGEIEVVRHYGHLPPVNCYVEQLNQVFMNILTNAIDALLNQAVRQNLMEELGQKPPAVLNTLPKPQITLTTQIRPAPAKAGSSNSRWVSIRIADNGPGLSVEKQQQILKSFSAEQRAAKETSLGVSYQIVTAKHGGMLLLRSPIATDSDSGTEFEILLPLT
ncbi:sensor histidine kinase [Phormidium tenue FACHB-886]|nr:sensor histidine kinase [Phormidium tenue FACHB-886]